MDIKDLTNRTMEVILAMPDKPVSQSVATKKVHITYATAYKIFNKIKDLDLINVEKVGRISLTSLTSRGKRLQEHLQGIKML